METENADHSAAVDETASRSSRNAASRSVSPVPQERIDMNADPQGSSPAAVDKEGPNTADAGPS